jgi:hypothetical protein
MATVEVGVVIEMQITVVEVRAAAEVVEGT